MAQEDANGPGADDNGRAHKHPGRRGPRATALIAALAGAAIIAFAVGFARFATSASSPADTARPLSADGIVVFTGGHDRINHAVALLDEGAARRLLISGVHPRTTRDMLVEMSGGDSELFRCCVDLDRSALDTTGNAEETAVWARRHGFGSLIVVTSGYHMERSLTELARALPDIRLERFAVATRSLDLEHWWRKPEAARLLLSEYVKLLAARSRGLFTAGPTSGTR